MEVSNLFVCAMGMGVTFFGLTCLILLMALLSKLSGQSASAPARQEPAPAITAPAEDIPNRQELIAAISAALAEELGTGVKGIRILSLKKIS